MNQRKRIERLKQTFKKVEASNALYGDFIEDPDYVFYYDLNSKNEVDELQECEFERTYEEEETFQLLPESRNSLFDKAKSVENGHPVPPEIQLSDDCQEKVDQNQQLKGKQITDPADNTMQVTVKEDHKNNSFNRSGFLGGVAGDLTQGKNDPILPLHRQRLME